MMMARGGDRQMDDPDPEGENDWEKQLHCVCSQSFIPLVGSRAAGGVVQSFSAGPWLVFL